MIIYKDKTFITNSAYPNTDWTDSAEYVLDDFTDAELCKKVEKLYPNFDLVVEEDKIIDVIPAYDINKILKGKQQQIKKWCEEKIISGIDADVLDRGLLHYSLTLTKQEDIKTLMLNIQNGANAVLWHDDSRVMHEIYTAEQFTNLYNQIFAYVITCKIRSDGLEQCALNLSKEDKADEIQAITWETELPSYLQEQVKAQINLMLGKKE